MKPSSDRLTLRGLYPGLKRALELRAQREKRSMEKAVIAILERELTVEKEAIKNLDQHLDLLSV